MPTIDLNSDLGEGLAPSLDDALLDLVTSANIACGGHAGDRVTMARTVRAARDRGVRIGAHPSYPDRAGFGRTTIEMASEELVETIVDQVSALSEIAVGEGTRVAYFKPHGALYNDAANEPRVAEAVAAAARELGLALMVLAGSWLANEAGVALITEGFIDRGYLPDGTLVPRSEPGALLTGPDTVTAQALGLAPEVDSLCIHSDTPGAPFLLRAARSALLAAGYKIRAT